MRKSPITLLSFAALLLASLCLQAQESEPRKITITAKKYEFSPSRIEMKVGETLQLIFQSQGSTHGFSCKELTSEKVKFKKGERHADAQGRETGHLQVQMRPLLRPGPFENEGSDHRDTLGRSRESRAES